MSSPAVPRQSPSINRGLCPSWCVTGHRADLGEEDWLHSGEPVPFADGETARLVMSIDPGTGAVDGPYVLIGAAEYSLGQATVLAERLLALVAVTAVSNLAASAS